MDRLGACFKLFDAVRIDHFRAFSAYWAVPAEAETAKEGQWLDGPKTDFFDAVNRTFKNPKIIAEDLGIIDDGVIDLLEKTQLPCMRVMQFAFMEGKDNMHMPHNYPKNCVAYTGTHDNDTILGWSQNADKKDVAYAMRYLNALNKYDLIDKMNECAMKCDANTCILTMQDLLHLGSEARMNIPSTLGNNWKWRMKKDDLTSSLSKSLLELTKQSERY